MGGLQRICPRQAVPASAIPSNGAHAGHAGAATSPHMVRRNSRAAKINHCGEALAIPFCSNR
jgi:hypothetical protein